MLLARATAIGPVVTPTSVFIFSLTFPITARATLPHVGILQTLSSPANVHTATTPSVSPGAQKPARTGCCSLFTTQEVIEVQLFQQCSAANFHLTTSPYKHIAKSTTEQGIGNVNLILTKLKPQHFPGKSPPNSPPNFTSK